MTAMFIDTGDNSAENDITLIMQIGQQYLIISTMFYFFLGLIFVFRNTVQGMGKPIIPLLSSITELCSRSFAAIYLAKIMGYKGIMYASPISWAAAGILVFAGYFYYIHLFSKDKMRWQLGAVKQHLREGTPAD